MLKSAVSALLAAAALALGAGQAGAVCYTETSGTGKPEIAPAFAAAETSPVGHPAAASGSAHVVRLEQGETLGTVLETLRVPPLQAKTVFQALTPHIDLKRLHAGQVIRVCVLPGASAGENDVFSISMDIGKRETLTASRQADGTLQATMVLAPVEKAVVRASGVIESSLFAAAGGAGVPDAVIVEMIRAFAWDVDFQRDIRTGDRFEILFNQFVDEAGELVETGNVLYARLILGDREIPLYRFETPDGSVEYYGADGKSIRKNLLRTPVDGARISSRFGMRRHPILGYNAMHRGVDFAAPAGTPIYAAGDGKVEFVGRHRGYGKYVRIRHGGDYATAYAHLSRYHKDLSAGDKVKQGEVIGYVGSTGRSTGPHLHFEVLHKGVQVNPSGVNNLPGRNLRGRDLAKFEKMVANLQRLLEILPTSIAAADARDAS